MTLALRLTVLALLAAPAPAFAIPGLEGHVTDPQHRLSGGDRERLVKKIDEVMQNTHIDLPVWISDVPPDDAVRQAEEAYKRWGIAKEWDNGVFLMFPSSGPVKVVLDRSRPELTAAELTRVVAADNPSADYAKRIDLVVDAVDPILRPKTRGPRPWGQVHAATGRWYALAAALVALAALAFTVLDRKPQPSA